VSKEFAGGGQQEDDQRHDNEDDQYYGTVEGSFVGRISHSQGMCWGGQKDKSVRARR